MLNIDMYMHIFIYFHIYLYIHTCVFIYIDIFMPPIFSYILRFMHVYVYTYFLHIHSKTHVQICLLCLFFSAQLLLKFL